MAKVIKSDIEPQSINAYYSLWRITLVGILMGIVYWALAAFIDNYSISVDTAGNIATILVATLSIIVMLRLRMAQSVIVAVASGGTLWGLAQLTRGLSAVEAAAWSVLLYGLAYGLFSWMARYVKPVPVLTAMIIVVITVRIVVNL